MIGVVVFVTIVYLFVWLVGGLAYHDFSRRRMTHVQAHAFMAMWPVLLPLLLIKSVFGTGSYFTRVIKEIPAEFGRLWRS